MNERQLFLKYLGQTSDSPLGLEVDHASGIYLYGPDGRSYIDLISGVSVSNCGHRHPYVMDAIKEQLEKYLHVNVYGEAILSVQNRYARYLCEVMGKPFGSVYFVNSGSEAIEGALKLARRYTRRPCMATFENAYHGSTHGAMSMMGSDRYTSAYRPLLPGITRLKFNSFEDIQKIDTSFACVLAEPVQAEAGVVEPVPGFLEALRKKCSETGTLLIFDEVQTGMGRTGSAFAFQKYGVVPDIIALAKAFGGGMPLGAFISSSAMMKVLSFNPPIGHITTFGGHPVSCAAGLASFELMMRERLFENVSKLNAIFRRELEPHKAVKEIRGSGLLMAVELHDKKMIPEFIRKGVDKGFVTDWFVFCDHSFRIAPPLIMTNEQAVKACSLIASALDEI